MPKVKCEYCYKICYNHQAAQRHHESCRILMLKSESLEVMKNVRDYLNKLIAETEKTTGETRNYQFKSKEESSEDN